MTEHLEAPKGFEARLLHALTEIDAARPAAPFSPAPVRRTRRTRRSLTIVVATLVVALGGTAVASASGLFDLAPPSVQRIFAGLDGHGRSVDAADAVRIGVIDDHVAYAAPTSGNRPHRRKSRCAYGLGTSPPPPPGPYAAHQIGAPLRRDDHHFAAIIIPGQSGTYRHLHGRVTGLLAESGLKHAGQRRAGELSRSRAGHLGTMHNQTDAI